MRRKIYDIAMSLVWFVVLTPCLFVLNSTVTGALFGIAYTIALACVLRSTVIGRWFFREVWKATLRLEYDIFGANSDAG